MLSHGSDRPETLRPLEQKTIDDLKTIGRIRRVPVN
jgi:hypothetical protein